MSEENNKNTEKKTSTWQDDFAIIGGLWKRTSKNTGMKYYAGKLFVDSKDDLESKAVNIRIYPNRHPKDEKSFEFFVYGSREDLKDVDLSFSNRATQPTPSETSESEAVPTSVSLE